ncbi:hypothetical protein MSP8886_03317 [Marinomonas spartinae]|uniref:Uncharacterized protein n=1 Tax=Marinomonas spartinae TaxID=1792290 RepID=A0A1A8TMI8_9GAMM|nr:hypothetical protein MSP8886_03317 [Marinomonas spartinae]
MMSWQGSEEVPVKFCLKSANYQGNNADLFWYVHAHTINLVIVRIQESPSLDGLSYVCSIFLSKP